MLGSPQIPIESVSKRCRRGTDRQGYTFTVYRQDVSQSALVAGPIGKHRGPAHGACIMSQSALVAGPIGKSPSQSTRTTPSLNPLSSRDRSATLRTRFVGDGEKSQSALVAGPIGNRRAVSDARRSRVSIRSRRGTDRQQTSGADNGVYTVSIRSRRGTDRQPRRVICGSLVFPCLNPPSSWDGSASPCTCFTSPARGLNPLSSRDGSASGDPTLPDIRTHHNPPSSSLSSRDRSASKR